jgi:6,7-dimethyl-8-ribityllumazine synthase
MGDGLDTALRPDHVPAARAETHDSMPSHFLIIEARFYPDITDELAKGAMAALERRGATFDRIAVPGVLEIPPALSMAVKADNGRYDGYVLLGCVIRGETTHYDIVANESARAIALFATEHALAVGNGILTVENGAQAWARARVGEKNKGGGAAAAAFEMVELRKRLGLSHG